MIYCDTSLLVAALVPEPETESVQRWLEQQAADQLATSDWGLTEFSSAIALKARRGDIPADRKSDVLTQWQIMVAERLILLPVPASAFALAARYCEMSASSLRAEDALHIAVASLGGHGLATLDAAMAEAAGSVGVRVIGV